MANYEHGNFLENKVAVITFTCNKYNYARTIATKKRTSASVLVLDVKAGTKDEGKKVYEVEMQPFPVNTKELSEYLFRAHGQFVHGSTEQSISDLRN